MLMNSVPASRSLWDTYERIAEGTPRPRTPMTRAEWERQAAELRKRLWRSLGVVPHAPQDPVATLNGTSEFASYTIERLTIETRPNFLVTANLYVPKGLQAPAPAILCPPGHNIDSGKAAPAYQSLYIGLARKGFVVLAPDAIGHGERQGLGHNGMGSPTLIGSSLIGMEVWDNLKCLDVLCARSEVDAKRIGCIGNSGGGTQTIWTAALDERIAVAIPSDATTSFAYNHAKERDICFCNLAPQIIPHAEIEHVLGLIAPRPLLLLGGDLDRVFPWDLQREVYRRTRRFYALYEQAERVQQFISRDPHSLTQAKREAAYAFFLKHLQGVNEPEAAKEPVDLEPLPTDHPALLCFSDPHVPPGLKRTLNAFVREEARILLKGLTSEGTLTRQRLRDVLKLPSLRERPQVQRTPIDERLESVTLWVDPDGPLSLTCIARSPDSGAKPTVTTDLVQESPRETSPRVRILIDRDGKDSAWCRDSVKHALAEGVRAVCVDVRGWGELTPRELADDGRLDEWVAMQKGIGYDRPLFGIRTLDLLATIDWVKETFAPAGGVELFAHGFSTLVALAAAVLSDDVTRLELSKLPASFIPPSDRSAHDALRYEYAFALVPGLISHVGDVPQLLQTLAPRPCRIVSLMEGTEPLSEPDVFGPFLSHIPNRQ